MEEKGSGPGKDDIAPAPVEVAPNRSKEQSSPFSLQEDSYKMTKTTYLAVLAFSWSWASVSTMNTTTTTISHQIASVGGAGELAWISNSSLIVQVALQAIMVNKSFILIFTRKCSHNTSFAELFYIEKTVDLCFVTGVFRGSFW